MSLRLFFAVPLCAAFALATADCASIRERWHSHEAANQSADTGTSSASTTSAKEAGTGPSEVVTFEKGRADLSENDMQSLRTMVNNARSNGASIDRVYVAAWSDQMFPQRGQELSRGDRDLAEQRAKNVRNFLKDQLSVSHVKDFNMAENSNWLARMFHTKDAELKSVFGQKGAAPMNENEFNVIKQNGGPSKSVVVVTLK